MVVNEVFDEIGCQVATDRECVRMVIGDNAVFVYICEEWIVEHDESWESCI
jgi:hypothetical protein